MNDLAKPLQVRWRNFRGFTDTDWVDIRPVTVLIGANNSGKTSFVTPFLLLKQTIESADEPLALKTRGPLVDAGMFGDLVFRHDRSLEVIFSFRFAGKDKTPAVRKKVGDEPPNQVELSFAVAPKSDRIFLQSYTIRDRFEPLFFKRVRKESGSYTIRGPVLSGISSQLPRNVYKEISDESPRHFFFGEPVVSCTRPSRT